MTFAAGQSEAEVLVRPADDDADDDCEAVVLGLGTLPAGLSPGLHTTLRVELRDNDGTDTWHVSFEAAAYTAPEGGAASVAVVLSEPWKPREPPCSGGVAALTIPLEAAAHGGGATAADYTVPTSVTIPAGATRATFAVRATDDAEDDDGESVTLAMGWQRFPDGLRTGRGPAETVVSLKDDDGVPEVKVSFGAAAYTAAEGGAAANVEVRLDRAPGRQVAVPLTTTPRGATTADYTGVPGSVTFGASQTVATFQVAATDDSESDDGESVDIGFGALPEAVTAGSPSVATVLIEDDDGDTPKYRVSLEAVNSIVRSLREGGCYRVHASLDRAPRSGAGAAAEGDAPARRHRGGLQRPAGEPGVRGGRDEVVLPGVRRGRHGGRPRRGAAGGVRPAAGGGLHGGGPGRRDVRHRRQRRAAVGVDRRRVGARAAGEVALRAADLHA